MTLELAEALECGRLVQLIAVLEPYAHESRVARLWRAHYEKVGNGSRSVSRWNVPRRQRWR